MKTTRWIVLWSLFFTLPAFGDATVQERGVNLDALAVVRLQANAAWKQMKEASDQAETAEQDLAEAERAHQEAQQRALGTAQRLEAARQELAKAQTNRKAATENWERLSAEVSRLMNGGGQEPFSEEQRPR